MVRPKEFGPQKPAPSSIQTFSQSPGNALSPTPHRKHIQFSGYKACGRRGKEKREEDDDGGIKEKSINLLLEEEEEELEDDEVRKEKLSFQKDCLIFPPRCSDDAGKGISEASSSAPH